MSYHCTCHNIKTSTTATGIYTWLRQRRQQTCFMPFIVNIGCGTVDFWETAISSIQMKKMH